MQKTGFQSICDVTEPILKSTFMLYMWKQPDSVRLCTHNLTQWNSSIQLKEQEGKHSPYWKGTLTFAFLRYSLKAWVSSILSSITSSCHIFNHKSPFSSYSSLPLFLSLSIATTTCNNWLLLSHLSFVPPPSRSLWLLPIFTTYPLLALYCPPFFSPSDPLKTPHAPASAEKVASLQTRKIHLELPSAASVPSSPRVWTLLRRNAPHLFSFQLTTSLLSLLDFHCF